MADRVHPLAASVAASPDCAAVQLATLPPQTRLIICGGAATLAAAGLTAPDACRCVRHGPHALLWLGPDEFMLLTSGDAIPSIANTVDVSHRDTALSVSGPRAAWAINAFCALDLHDAAFPVGMCARTLLGRAPVLLWRTAEATFRIEATRSLAPYVWTCLEEARREFLA
jgi:heterotetrameric sarcosine oxidase gamma subunit